VGSYSQTRRIPSGMALLIGTGMLWGTIGVASRGVFEHSALDPVAVTWIRTLLASPICILASGFPWPPLLRFSTEICYHDRLGSLLVCYQWLYLAAIEQIE